MPRQARVPSSMDYYHVMIRGINKEFVFRSKDQKEKIIKLIEDQVHDELLEVGAWCIMDNHVHLLLKANLDNMAKAIKIINLKYAAYYNKSKERTGPVFGDRYRSENIEDDRYFLGVVRYIHNNPLNAKLVEKGEDYKWSSYKSLISNKNVDGLISREVKEIIQDLFGGNSTRYKEFHNEEDDRIFLDTREDMERVKSELGQKIIQEFFKTNGIADAKELKFKPNLIEELVKRLAEKSKLPIRKIAQLTGLSIGTIYSMVVD